jgi:hypothetical protein
MKIFIKKYLFGIVCRKPLHYLNWILNKIEPIFSDRSDKPLRYPPIFIIGAPRSGSTLLYQVMTEYYDVGYLSNLHCRFYGAASWVERLVHPLRWRKPSNFTSRHGVTKGIAAPSECGAFWYRFFRQKPQYIPIEEANPRQLRRLRGAVRALIHAFDKPILFKNMNCALRLRPTAKMLPEALFIVTQRNLLDNAHSLLEVRKKVHRDYQTWWGMEPPNIDNLTKLSSHEQVVKQVQDIMELIAIESNVFGKNKFFYVDYDLFCKNPQDILNKMDDFFTGHGIVLRKMEGKRLLTFKKSQTIRIDSALYEQLQEYIDKQK